MAVRRAGKASWPGRFRAAIPFRIVNRKGTPGYDSGLQRHHSLLRQLLTRNCFGRLFDALGYKHVGFDDFRANGFYCLPMKTAHCVLGCPCIVDRTVNITIW